MVTNNALNVPMTNTSTFVIFCIMFNILFWDCDKLKNKIKDYFLVAMLFFVPPSVSWYKMPKILDIVVAIQCTATSLSVSINLNYCEPWGEHSVNTGDRPGP